MTTGNTQTIGGQPRIRRSLALLCAAALLLGLWMPWAKAAVGDTITITVEDPGGAPVEGLAFTTEGTSALAETPAGTYTGTLTSDATTLALSLDATQHIIVSGTVGGNPITIDRGTNSASFAPNAADTTVVTLVVTPAIGLTVAAGSCIYSCYQPDINSPSSYMPPSFTVAAGLPLTVDLHPPHGQSFVALPEGTSPIASCTIGGTSVTMTGFTTTPDSASGTIPGDALATGGELVITLDETKLEATKMIGVIEVTGAGYRLYAPEPAPAPKHQLLARLDVEAAYSNSTPVLTPGDSRFSISEPRKEPNPDTGGFTYDYDCTMRDAASFEDNIVITVTGIVPNAPPPSGGGDSGGGGGGGDSSPATPPTPTIRVENELNQEKSSSDTMLWPGKTVEADGVSTTTVTDAELAALLELARAHKADADSLEGDGLKEGILVVENLKPTSDNQSYVLELTGKQFETLTTEGWDRLTVQTPAGSFSLYPEALTQAGTEITEGSQPVRITLHQLDYENRPGVDASLTVDKNQVTSFETPYGVRIVVPYTPAPGEDLNALAIDYIHEDGTVERVTESHYDKEAGGIVFFTTHLSKFGVTYRPAAFADVTAKHWANPYVTFLTARGVIRGNPGGSYRPDDPITRGEFLSLLTRGLSAAKLPSKPVQIFADVPSKSFVAGASNWLFFNNLAAPLIQNNRLQPQTAITREDMASLVGSVSSGVGLRLRSKGLDTGYTDLKQIADYAQPSVTKLRAAGILEMAKNFKFNPKTTLNRGEAAQIVATLLSNL